MVNNMRDKILKLLENSFDAMDLMTIADKLNITSVEDIENLKFETICNLFELPKLEKDTSLNNVKQLFILYKKLTEK